jgi:Polyphosphate kinase 2 (PPK2)
MAMTRRPTRTIGFIGLQATNTIGYYEEVLVVRVHAALLQQQHLPPELITANLWQKRLRDIRRFERYLHRNGVRVCKFFLHVSPQEQKKRFLERIDTPRSSGSSPPPPCESGPTGPTTWPPMRP